MGGTDSKKMSALIGSPYSSEFEFVKIKALRLASVQLNGKTQVLDADNATQPEDIVAREMKEPGLLPLTMGRLHPVTRERVWFPASKLRFELKIACSPWSASELEQARRAMTFPH